MKKNTVLWIVQALLGVTFLLSGASKFAMSADQMIEATKASGSVLLPIPFVRFIGACEILGGIGVVVPWLTGIRPRLTPLAAAGLVIIMIGATVLNLMSAIPAVAIATAILGLLAAFVAYGRGSQRQTITSKRVPTT